MLPLRMETLRPGPGKRNHELASAITTVIHTSTHSLDDKGSSEKEKRVKSGDKEVST